MYIVKYPVTSYCTNICDLCFRPMPTYFDNFVFIINVTKAAYCPLLTLMYILHFVTIYIDYGWVAQSITQ